MDQADFFSVIYACGRVSSFRDTPVPQDLLAEILFAGSRAQTTGDQQLFKFIVLREEERIKGLYDACYEDDAVMSAQAAIVLAAEDDLAEKHFGLRGKRLYVIQDCAAAAQNMLLAATALGLGARWVHAFDEEQVAAHCSIPAEARPQAVLLFGYPAEEVERPPLKDFRYLINWDGYGAKYKDPHIIINDFAVHWEKMGAQFKRALRRGTRRVRERFGGMEDGASTESAANSTMKAQLAVHGARVKKGVKKFLKSLKK